MRIPAFPPRTVVHSLTLIVALIALLIPAPAAHAQDAAPYTLQADSKLWIDGTSTRSDWTVHAADVQGTFGITGSGADHTVASGKIAVQAKKIESGKTIMDRLMHDALQVEEHPTISYELTSAERGATSSDDGSVTLNTTGKLTLAGTTKTITMPVKAVHAADGKIRFTGSYPLKMSDYGMEAPIAMFGALRTGDDVTIHFDVVAVPAK